MVEYKFFWPAALSVSETFPTQEEIDAGLAGGDGIGAGASGELPIGFTNLEDWGEGVVWVGGPNVVFTGQADRGENSPTDVDFVAQRVIYPEVYAELNVVENPNPDLTLNYADPIDPLPLLDLSKGASLEIDIRTTTIIDSDNPDVTSTLDTIYKKINPDSTLVINVDALYGDDSHEDGETFDYRYDTDGETWGAGTAFLKPSS
jgi:hypothetical protein